MADFIETNRGRYGVESIRSVLPIAPSTFYEHQAREKNPDRLPARAKRDAKLRVEIDRVWRENRQVYGVRKVWKQLNRENTDVARVALDASIARYILSPFPAGSENPVVALMALDAPVLLWLAHGWYAAMPGVVVVIGVTLFSGVWRVWFEAAPTKKQGKGGLPPWPVAASDKNPAIVVGETHHPVEAREVPNPEWLVIPERNALVELLPADDRIVSIEEHLGTPH